MEGKLLIVDDEEGVRSSLQEYFKCEGYFVEVAIDGDQAFEVLETYRPNLIILDVQMPNKDGLEICRLIRQTIGQSINIIMISGIKKEMVDRVVGLEVGADVYMTKPFETRELLAQVRALLRREKEQLLIETTGGWQTIDDYLRINFRMRTIEAGGNEVYLTRLEFDLLEHLIKQAGKPCGRSDLVDEVWGYEAGGDISDGAVNTCVAKLRAKIEQDPTNPKYIQSVHGIGYRFMKLE